MASFKEEYKDGDDNVHYDSTTFDATDIALASGKIMVGQSTGLASAVTPSGDVTLSTAGVATIAAAAVTSSKIDESVLQIATVSITNSEMLNLRATPKTLVAAPGAGKILSLVTAVLLFDYTGAYTETTDNMAIRFTNGSGVIVSDTIEATGFVDATADTVTFARKAVDGIVAKSASENQALVLHNTGDGEYGGGNAANAVRVKVAYRVITTGF